MKPSPFAYVNAGSLDQVCDLLRQHGGDARILAGGQSLIATLNMRLSAPELLIDINHIDGLSGIAVADGTVRIGEGDAAGLRAGAWRSFHSARTRWHPDRRRR